MRPFPCLSWEKWGPTGAVWPGICTGRVLRPGAAGQGGLRPPFRKHFERDFFGSATPEGTGVIGFLEAARRGSLFFRQYSGLATVGAAQAAGHPPFPGISEDGGSQSPARQYKRPCPQLLRDYAWPGNLRELRNVLMRVVLTATGTRVDAAMLHAVLKTTQQGGSAGTEEHVYTEQKMVQLAWDNTLCALAPAATESTGTAAPRVCWASAPPRCVRGSGSTALPRRGVERREQGGMARRDGRLSPDILCSIRRKAVEAVTSGELTQQRAAEVFGVTRVARRVRAFRQEGKAALTIRCRRRPHGALIGQDRAAILLQLLARGLPERSNIAFPLWHRESVGLLIERLYGLALPLDIAALVSPQWGCGCPPAAGVFCRAVRRDGGLVRETGRRKHGPRRCACRPFPAGAKPFLWQCLSARGGSLPLSAAGAPSGALAVQRLLSAS